MRMYAVLENMRDTGWGLGGDLIQLAFRTTKHRPSSHLDCASKTSVLNTCRNTFFGLMIIRNSRKEELGRKLRRRGRRKLSQTHKTLNLVIPQQHEREWKFIEFYFQSAESISSSRRARVFLSAEQPTAMRSIIALRINDNSLQVSWWLQMT